MSDVYYSIEQPAKAELKEKGSKFLSFAYPAKEEEEIKNLLKDLKERYWDASHHCYAYMLGAKGEVFRANDAGEPNHSAGDPILSQIKSFKITDVLIVVVRYFGGTKLGVSGLISAYKESARMVLEEAKIVEKYIKIPYTITFGFEQMSYVMKVIKSCECDVKEQSFESETIRTIIKLTVRKSFERNFLDDLQGSQGIEITGNL
jgi:uncharacterized YigZ family protein